MNTKYHKIYHKNCVVPAHVLELTEDEFNKEVDNYVYSTVDAVEDEDGNIDYDKSDAEYAKATDEIMEQAETEDGFDAGDFNLYIISADVPWWDRED